jgi:hypothetical protein
VQASLPHAWTSPDELSRLESMTDPGALLRDGAAAAAAASGLSRGPGTLFDNFFAVVRAHQMPRQPAAPQAGEHRPALADELRMFTKPKKVHEVECMSHALLAAAAAVVHRVRSAP